MLRDSVVVVVVVVVVVRTRPRAIPLAMIAIRKILHGFPFLSREAYGASLGGPSGRRSSAIKIQLGSKAKRTLSKEIELHVYSILLFVSSSCRH